MADTITIIGAGQAAISCAEGLRKNGFTGAITMIGDEPVAPYQRPPLSKKYVTGAFARERLFLKPESYYHDAGITLLTGQSVQAIDPGAHTLKLGGETHRYDKLVIATGAAARRLPARHENLYVMRDLADAEAMRDEFVPGRRLVVIGGGYIGLEAAAAARTQGLDVTVIEAAPRLLARVAAAATAQWFHTLHTERGVRILTGQGVTGFDGNARIEAVTLADGTRIPADFVIAGIGVTPNDALARAAGLVCDNGIWVDDALRTSDPDIYAIGDVANFVYQDTRLRLESVPNAIDMGVCVAKTLAGSPTKYTAKPWFWSDQFDIKLQIAGLAQNYNRVVVRDGATPSHWYYQDDRLEAVYAMNDARAYTIGKRLIDNAKSLPPDITGDPNTDLMAAFKAL